MVVCLYYLQENLQLCLLEKNPPIQRVLCAFPKDKTPLLIIVCCWILLEESSFQKHPECPFDQPSKILQSSLTEYLIPYFTLAFCHIYSERQVEHPSKNSTNCDSECLLYGTYATLSFGCVLTLLLYATCFHFYMAACREYMEE